ncbi:MAG: ParB/RepB/Spo0J family partition protein [Thermoleophilia bacterium]
MSSKKALGKGLGALIGESRGSLNLGEVGDSRLREIPVGEIVVNRRQPRRTFDPLELEELAASIGSLGMVQPVVVRPHTEQAAAAAEQMHTLDRSDVSAVAPRYELIAGERRLRAAKLAGLTRVPALVRQADEVAALEIAIAENVAREDLNSIEEAYAYAALVDEFGLTHERVADLVGRSRAAVSNILRLLELPDDVQRLLELGDLSEGHGRALLGLPDQAQRRNAASQVVAQGLNVRQTEGLVRRIREQDLPSAQGTARADSEELNDLVDELYGVFAAPVRIRAGRRGGSIQIVFRDKSDLDRLVALLRSIG